MRASIHSPNGGMLVAEMRLHVKLTVLQENGQVPKPEVRCCIVTPAFSSIDCDCDCDCDRGAILKMDHRTKRGCARTRIPQGRLSISTYRNDNNNEDKIKSK